MTGRNLKFLNNKYRPSLVFLMETRVNKKKVESWKEVRKWIRKKKKGVIVVRETKRRREDVEWMEKLIERMKERIEVRPTEEELWRMWRIRKKI